ncbi:MULTISPECIES: SIR2 family protein [Pasteurellaceae]|uniref:SIR2 family protein n=1 Tax=Pasteurella atlantica TaxID=2827233 RepID=A0AAW8CPF3_9PAST|nr:SIR2 family protein [Pasteurella atlantica]MBR0573296.1 SIR2 family protein [Pasteurella atlantica]MDP8040152.1 SIR2 family protein [Pasteurella atlantica]MDP8042265.1 SIR2 family protein [Pasteurella atlantica]MDP8044428.1 SIR2 family protein [Pasteurella atlantica]MDP8046440.1 SIR2 family protein [Pasteurella atlantica]
MNIDTFFKTVQRMLSTSPTIIWGSGATVPLGLPTMPMLSKELADKIKKFNGNNKNLEQELSDPKYINDLDEIRKIIWNTIHQKDIEVRNKVIEDRDGYIQSVKNLVCYLKKPHPELVNIITTNYDRVLETILSYYDITFTDGFIDKDLSTFNEDLFLNKNIVNIIKVHGSLNWFNISGSVKFSPSLVENKDLKIIIPSSLKYQEAYESPYRELIQKSDQIIQQSKSFLIVGFGFNDKHLTPKVKQRVENNIPIVVITKEITDSCKAELINAQQYLLIEEGKSTNTQVTYKNNTDISVMEIEGDYWKLDKFMEILQ